MTDAKREQISALLDSELSEQEVGQTIDLLLDQSEFKETWGRYHLIGDVIRGEAQGKIHQSIAEQVQQKLKSEPAILAAPKPKKSHVEWIAGAALAASVAILTVMAAPHFLNPENDVPPNIASTDTPPVPAAINYPSSAPAPVPVSAQLHRFVSSTQKARGQLVVAPVPNARWYTLPPVGTNWKNQPELTVQSKLNKYLVDHSEYAVQGGMVGVVPYATFVGYDAR